MARTKEKRTKRNHTIALKDENENSYKDWAVTVDRFFSGYKDTKDIEFKPLSKEDEDALFEKYKNDRQEFENQLIQHNIFLAVNMAGKYSAYNTDYDEILSSAMYGLNVAARKFDPSRGTKFSTCATWWIRKYILLATTSNRYNKNIGSKVVIYLDAPDFTKEREEENYNYTTFSKSIEPSFAHIINNDTKSPYDTIAKNEIRYDNNALIEKITKSVTASSLSERDKSVYVKMFVDGLDSNVISEELGISKHAIAKSRSRIASYISENFSNYRESV